MALLYFLVCLDDDGSSDMSDIHPIPLLGFSSSITRGHWMYYSVVDGPSDLCWSGEVGY